jgi:ubiquinone/menaquinone biosynthesis C-methylase UbiE
MSATVRASWFRVLPEALHGARVLDIGCGQGRTCRYLASKGAALTGVDASGELLRIAQARAAVAEPEIRYLQGDATQLAWWDGQPFDGAVVEMSLMDFDDLDGAVRVLATVVRRDGWAAVSLFHPCFPGSEGPASWPPEHGYHWAGRWAAEGADGIRGSVGANHRSVVTYLSSFLIHGWRLDAVVEPPFGNVPTILLLRFVRT